MKKVIFEMDMPELSTVEAPIEYKTELGIFYDYNKAEDVKSTIDEIKNHKDLNYVLNADRDFYQALVAQQDYDLLKIKDEKDAAKKDYEENMAQTSERVSKAIQAVEKDKIFWENIKTDKGAFL